MRRPPTALETITVLCTLAAVVWVIGKTWSSHPDERGGPQSMAVPDPGEARALRDSLPAPRATARRGADRQDVMNMAPVSPRTSPFQDNFELSSLLQELLAGADPETAALLERGMHLLQAGNFPESRREFQSILDSYPESVLRAPAQWGLALSYYREGGEENMALSAGRFADFLARYSSFKPEVLVEAAQLDLAVICMNIMQTGVTERERADAAAAAARCLQTFLERWPDNPQAPAARVSLQQVQNFLASLQVSRVGE